MKYLLAWLRIVLLVLVILIFLSAYLISALIRGRNIHRAFRFRKTCIKIMGMILGYQITRYGHFDEIQPAIYISNHRCFSDPILALHYYHFLPIGKAEIERYPLIGLAAEETGILFVQRHDKTSRNKVKEGMRQKLRQNLSIFLCPEGTTSVLQLTKEFKKGAFEIAVEENIPIVPLAMVYHQPELDFWIPGDSLLTHFIKQFGKWKTKVDVHFPDHLYQNEDPMVLMQECQAWIDQKLSLVPVPQAVIDRAVDTLKV